MKNVKTIGEGKERFYNNFEKLIEILPTIQQNVMDGLKKEFEIFEYDPKQLEVVFNLIRRMTSSVQGKWNIEICFTLLIFSSLSYNDLRRALPKISSRTLTDKLRILEKNRILQREVVTGKQIRVYYSLTAFGMQEITLLFPAFLNFILPPRKKKNYPSLDTFHKYFPSEEDK